MFQHRLNLLIDDPFWSFLGLCSVDGPGTGASSVGGEGSNTTTTTPPTGGTTTTPPGGGQSAATTTVEPKTLTLTETELQARINQVAGSVRREVRDQFGGDPDDIKAKLAKLDELERGQLSEKERLEKERDDEKAARTRAETEAQQLRIENALHKYVAANHPAYLGKEEWITPKIATALGDKKPTPQNIEAAVKEAVDAFVQAVPIATTGGSGNREQPGSQPGPPRNGAPGAQQVSSATKEALGYLQGAGFHLRQ